MGDREHPPGVVAVSFNGRATYVSGLAFYLDKPSTEVAIGKFGVRLKAHFFDSVASLFERPELKVVRVSEEPENPFILVGYVDVRYPLAAFLVTHADIPISVILIEPTAREKAERYVQKEVQEGRAFAVSPGAFL